MKYLAFIVNNGLTRTDVFTKNTRLFKNDLRLFIIRKSHLVVL